MPAQCLAESYSNQSRGRERDDTDVARAYDFAEENIRERSTKKLRNKIVTASSRGVLGRK
jgi:hypothetical protein